VGTNDPASISAVFNDKTGDYDVVVGPTMEIPETGV
jgi:hypothetical protein